MRAIQTSLLLCRNRRAPAAAHRQTRFAELKSDPAQTSRLLRIGADKARAIAAVTLDRARTNIGLLSP